MVRRLCGASAALLAGGVILFNAGCTGVVYSGGAEAYYDYDYYPDWDVYYYPEGGIYYWYDGGYWHHGAHAPSRFAFEGEQAEHLHLHSSQPWIEHHEAHGPEHFEGHGPEHFEGQAPQHFEHGAENHPHGGDHWRD